MLFVKKRFFASHAKSSAAVISLMIHGLFVLVALTFVAVSVIHKEDLSFEAKTIKRPKMQLRKLQLPVNVQKKRMQKPKLRKRILVQPRLNQVPDIKMPEITGVKGGIGSAAGDGLGGGGGVGFSMPEMKLFGIKSRGEKVFIILDASGFMMVDKMGGIPAYTIRRYCSILPFMTAAEAMRCIPRWYRPMPPMLPRCRIGSSRSMP